MSGLQRLVIVTMCMVGIGSIWTASADRSNTMPFESLESANREFELATNCPGSFEKNQDGNCEFRSQYERYFSRDGIGGLRVGSLELQAGYYTPQQIDLGRILFFDPILSRDGSISCAHCHHPDHGLSDGRGRSIGFGGRGIGPKRQGGAILERNAPTLWNVGFLDRLFWDGREESLEEQAKGPLFSPEEMNNTEEHLETTLGTLATYKRLFGDAFGHDQLKEGIKVSHVAKALAAFQSTLVSFNSRYDQYAHGNESALTPREHEGHNIFRSFVMRCSQCHTPPLFTNNQFAVIGAPEPEGMNFDVGAGKFFEGTGMKGAFKVPTLRNIVLTAPYMHSGRFHDLNEVVDFYNDRRGHAVPKEEELVLHWHIHLAGPVLSAEESEALMAFLATLTDESMLPLIPNKVPSGLPVVKTKSSESS